MRNSEICLCARNARRAGEISDCGRSAACYAQTSEAECEVETIVLPDEKLVFVIAGLPAADDLPFNKEHLLFAAQLQYLFR